MTECEDCGEAIHPLANHAGCELWCEDCFDKGLTKDMKNHWGEFWKRELSHDQAE